MFTKTSLRNLQKSIDRADKKLAKKFEEAVTLGALFLLGKSQEIVPVEYGLLRASGGVRREGNGWNSVAYVYYTADYAVYVHENVRMKLKGQRRPSKIGLYWDASIGPGSSKFLEKPSRRYRKEIIRVIRNHMKS